MSTSIDRSPVPVRAHAAGPLGLRACEPHPAGAPAATASALHEHDGLVSMARIITGSEATAQGIVLRVVRVAPPDAGPPGEATGRAGTGVDPVLVSAVFGACRVWLQSEVRATGTTNEAIDWVARISAQQRCAVALYLHGAQSPPRIARLLDVPTRTVCRLLLAAMDELVGADLTARRGNPGPPTGSATR